MNEPKAMDAIDKRILRIIQKNASLSIREIGTQVGLSQTACWKKATAARCIGRDQAAHRAARSDEGRARINRLRFGPGG